MSRYFEPRGKKGPSLATTAPGLAVFFAKQRERISRSTDRLVARYQRRVHELSPKVETRGIPQPCDMEYRRRYKGVVGDYEF